MFAYQIIPKWREHGHKIIGNLVKISLAAQKSQKLENLTADREKLREIRKVAHREAERILRDAKKEVQRQAMSSRLLAPFASRF